MGPNPLLINMGRGSLLLPSPREAGRGLGPAPQAWEGEGCLPLVESKSSDDLPDRPIHRFVNISILKTDHPVAIGFQPCCPGLVPCQLAFLAMCCAINLNDKPFAPAQKIHDIRTYWLLPHELVPFDLPIPKSLPQQSFGSRRFPPKSAGKLLLAQAFLVHDT
jgi:hypothetical protein